MAQLTVPKLALSSIDFDYATLRAQLKDLPWNPIQQAPWRQEYPYIPTVSFQIGHTAENLYIHYAVEEEALRAQYSQSNEAVWNDSCVEFFISFDQKKTYYNLEFNILGTGLVGYGTSVKADRNRLTAEAIEQVHTLTSIARQGEKKCWNIILKIPVGLFSDSGISSFEELAADANFYKCGDALPQPHFIAWNPIDNPSPNFHLPQFFGSLTFD